jgi:hypothetical protein
MTLAMALLVAAGKSGFSCRLAREDASVGSPTALRGFRVRESP